MVRKIKLLHKENDVTYHLPIFLSQKIDDIGVYSYFDGNIETFEKCGFTYSGNGMTIIIYNSTNSVKNKEYANSTFRINWGDGDYDELPMLKIDDVDLPNISHTYSSVFKYEIEVSVISPWLNTKIKKEISVPFKTSYPINLGELTFKLPYNEEVELTQQYKQDFSLLTGKTEHVTINFIGFGKSRIGELKKYGENNEYNGINISSEYTGYTIDNLYYMDFPDGFTQIIGNTEGNPDEFFIKSEEYNGMLTRNEIFIGFIGVPQIYSDIDIDRGRLSVLENNFKLLEVNNVGELVVYGNNFFTIKKQ